MQSAETTEPQAQASETFKVEKKTDIDVKNVQEEAKEQVCNNVLGLYLKDGNRLFQLGLVVSIVGYCVNELLFNVFISDVEFFSRFDFRAFFAKILIFQFLFILTNFIRLVCIAVINYRLTKTLHIEMVSRILHSSLNGFFRTNHLGKVINRLSGDQQNVDNELMNQQTNFFAYLQFFILNMLIVVLFTSKMMALLMIPVILLLLQLRSAFSESNIRIQSLHQTTLSPYFSLFSDLVNGNQVIAISRKADFYFEKATKIVNRNFGTVILNAGARNWFHLRIFIYIYALIFLAIGVFLVFYPEEFHWVPLIMLGLLRLLKYTRFISEYNTLENQLVSYARCKQLTQIPLEKGVLRERTHCPRRPAERDIQSERDPL